MSVSQAQQEVSSPEFAEWRAFYQLESEQATGDKGTPTPDELGSKLRQWAQMQNARTGK